MQTVEIAERLELFRAFLGLVGANVRLEPRVPLLVYVFGDSRSYARFRPRSVVVGFMLPRTERNFLVIDASRGTNARTTALHEYVHFVLRNGEAMQYPVWYDEGLAEMLSTLAIGDKHVIVGNIPETRKMWLLVGSPLSLRRLMTAEDPYEWSDRALARFYAQAWATVHFFFVSDRVGFPKRASQMMRYIELVDAGREPDAACLESFGADFEALEKDFLNYLAKGELPYVGFRLDRLDLPRTDTTRALPEYDRRYLLGELARALGDPWFDEAERWFRLAIRAQPNAGQARAALGRLLATSDIAQSDALLAHGLALAGDDADVQRLYGEALLERAIAGQGDEARLVAEARRAFRRSLVLDPEQIAAHAQLGRSYLVAPNSGDPEEGLSALRTAHERLPADRIVALSLARLELATGAAEQARALLSHMPPPSHGDPAVSEQRSVIAEARHSAGLPAPNPLATRHLETRLDIESPEREHQVRGLLGWVGVIGRGGLWESTLHDVVIAIDESTSTLIPTGADLDGDGVVGKPRTPYGINPNSGSSDPDDIVIRAELEAARALIRQLDPATTRVAVLTFAGGATVRAPLGSPEAALSALDDYEVHVNNTGTSLAAALAESLTQFFQHREGGVRRQRTILLLSDGHPTVPSERHARHDALELAAQLGDAGIAIQAFALGQEAVKKPEFYRTLAERSGGKFVPVENSADVVSHLATVRFTGLRSIEIRSSPANESGRAVRVFPDGSFDGYASLVEGENFITITAHMDGGRTISERRTVFFERPTEPEAEDRQQAARLRAELKTRALQLELHAEIIRRRRTPSATRHLEVEAELGAEDAVSEPRSSAPPPVDLQ